MKLLGPTLKPEQQWKGSGPGSGRMKQSLRSEAPIGNGAQSAPVASAVSQWALVSAPMGISPPCNPIAPQPLPLR
jgi:hypothetical protein